MGDCSFVFCVLGWHAWTDSDDFNVAKFVSNYLSRTKARQSTGRTTELRLACTVQFKSEAPICIKVGKIGRFWKRTTPYVVWRCDNVCIKVFKTYLRNESRNLQCQKFELEIHASTVNHTNALPSRNYFVRSVWDDWNWFTIGGQEFVARNRNS